MIVEKILGQGFYIIKDHVKNVHTDKFQLIQITNKEEVFHTGTSKECETYYYDNFPMWDGMS